jgi:hypothetical protein
MAPKAVKPAKAVPAATKTITKSPKKTDAKADAKEAKAAKAAKKAAKEDKPKRAPGPYMLFCKATRPTIVTENPSFTFGEVGKALGAAWKALSDEDKAAYKQ